MHGTEIVLPETKPETEWVRGRARRKVSPQRDHSRVQSALVRALDDWAGDRGEAGVEWRFRLAPPGEIRRPLVPDVAFVSYDKLRGLTHDAIQSPDFAPDVAVEVFSRGDSRRDLMEKISVYLRCGCAVVLTVDPATRSIVSHERSGVTRRFSGNDIFAHVALPAFELRLASFFARALDIPAASSAEPPQT